MGGRGRTKFSLPATGDFRVLLVSPTFEPGFRGGGPVRSLARTVDTVSKQISVLVVTRDRDVGMKEPYLHLSGRYVARGRSHVFYLNDRSVRQWVQLARDLRRQAIDMLYLNSLFHPVYSVLPLIACRLGLIRPEQILLAPRGELSPGAVALKSRKKQSFLRVWIPILRSLELTWHASTAREASDVCRWVPGAKVVVSLNQTALPAESLRVDGACPSHARFVFVSRISPKKNLLLAIEAFTKLRSRVDFDIYGPVGDRKYWNECKLLLSCLPQNVRARYRGELVPEDVRPTLAKYDALILPTLGENFGHIVIESLSAGCPVICSDATPWTPLIRAGGGTVLAEITAEALRVELEKEAGRSPGERIERKRGAGMAFQAWRSTRRDSNVLDEMFKSCSGHRIQ